MKNLDQQIKELTKHITTKMQQEFNKQPIKIKVREENNMFTILDDKSESYLNNLLLNEEIRDCPFTIQETNCKEASIVEYLIENGFLNSQKGVQYFLDGGFICCARLTQKAKAYNEMKEKYQMEQRTIGNIGNYNDLRGADLSYSNNQIGNSTAIQNIQVTEKVATEIVEEISNKVETYGLSQDEKDVLMDLVDDIKQKKNKKPNILKRAVLSVWHFAKDVGCGLLTAYLQTKLGL